MSTSNTDLGNLKKSVSESSESHLRDRLRKLRCLRHLGDDFRNFRWSLFLELCGQPSTLKSKRWRSDDDVNISNLFFLWKWNPRAPAHADPSCIKNRFNVQLSFSTSSSERHRLDFNVEHWSRNYQKVDPRKFWKSPRRSHPKTPLSKTSKVAPQKFRNPSPGSSTHRRYRLVFSSVTASDSDASLASGRSRPAASSFLLTLGPVFVDLSGHSLSIIHLSWHVANHDVIIRQVHRHQTKC
jgi:hypothetical protein